MTVLRTTFAAAFTIAQLVFGADPIAAQSSDPAWLDDVRQQMATDQGCTVELFINIREGTRSGRTYFETRVQCRDGRLFDATRTEPEKKFTIKVCEVQVC